jgi:glycerol-3-phosphate dehydrogenase
VDLLCRKLGRAGARSATDRTPLDGGDFGRFDTLVNQIDQETAHSLGNEAATALAHNHGSQYRRVLSLLQENAAWGQRLGASTTLKAEVVNAIRDEMAIRLSDIVFRRTDLATGGHPGAAALDEAAKLAALELGWDQRRQAEEIASVEQRFGFGLTLRE